MNLLHSAFPSSHLLMKITVPLFAWTCFAKSLTSFLITWTLSDVPKIKSKSGFRARSAEITVVVVVVEGCGVGSLYNTILGNNDPILRERFPLASRIEPAVSHRRVR